MYKCFKPNGELDEEAFREARRKYKESPQYRGTAQGKFEALPWEEQEKILAKSCRKSGYSLDGARLSEDALAELDWIIAGRPKEGVGAGASSSSKGNAGEDDASTMDNSKLKMELEGDKAAGNSNDELSDSSASGSLANISKKIKKEEADDADDAAKGTHSKFKSSQRALPSATSLSKKSSKDATSSRLQPRSTASGGSSYGQGNYGGRRAVKLEDEEDDDDDKGDKGEEQRPATRRRLA